MDRNMYGYVFINEVDRVESMKMPKKETYHHTYAYLHTAVKTSALIMWLGTIVVRVYHNFTRADICSVENYKHGSHIMVNQLNERTQFVSYFAQYYCIFFAQYLPRHFCFYIINWYDKFTEKLTRCDKKLFYFFFSENRRKRHLMMNISTSG